MWPWRCRRSPQMVSSSSVLPAPDGPSTTSTRPGATATSTGPSRKDPAPAVSPQTSSPPSCGEPCAVGRMGAVNVAGPVLLWSVVCTAGPGQQAAGGQRTEDQESGQRDDQQDHRGGGGLGQAGLQEPVVDLDGRGGRVV